MHLLDVSVEKVVAKLKYINAGDPFLVATRQYEGRGEKKMTIERK
jgi:hypothetical protein